jgi:hypothetical protein
MKTVIITETTRSEYAKPRLVDYGSLKQLVLEATKNMSIKDVGPGQHKELIVSLP